MSVHTKGPWSVEEDEDEGRIIIVMDTRIDSPGYYTAIHEVVVADCIEPDEKGYDEALANANVMAAAPELYEALKELHALVLGECPSLLDEDSGGDARLCMEIEDALKKARGEA